MFVGRWESRCCRVLARIWSRWVTELHLYDDFLWPEERRRSGGKSQVRRESAWASGRWDRTSGRPLLFLVHRREGDGVGRGGMQGW